MADGVGFGDGVGDGVGAGVPAGAAGVTLGDGLGTTSIGDGVGWTAATLPADDDGPRETVASQAARLGAMSSAATASTRA